MRPSYLCHWERVGKFFLTSNTLNLICTASEIVSFLDPPPKRKGGSGKYSTVSYHGLAVAMDSAKSEAFEVSCWASVNLSWSVKV